MSPSDIRERLRHKLEIEDKYGPTPTQLLDISRDLIAAVAFLAAATDPNEPDINRLAHRVQVAARLGDALNAIASLPEEFVIEQTSWDYPDSKHDDAWLVQFEDELPQIALMNLYNRKQKGLLH